MWRFPWYSELATRMNLVTVVAVLVSALCVVLAQNDGRYRPPTTSARPLTTRYRPYRPYDPFNQYRNFNQGRYVARNDGRYSGAYDGRYVSRNDGKYVHVEGPSGPGAGKYIHVAGPSGPGAGKYSHVEGSSRSGFAGQGLGAGAGAETGTGVSTDAPTAPPTPAFVPTTPIPVLAQRAPVRTAPPKPYDSDDSKILRLEHNYMKDGYQYIFETQNGINVEESGRIEPDGNGGEGLRSTGYYEYIGDDGKLYRVDYVADTNGFVPQGDHIPKGSAGSRDASRLSGPNIPPSSFSSLPSSNL